MKLEPPEKGILAISALLAGMAVAAAMIHILHRPDADGATVAAGWFLLFFLTFFAFVPALCSSRVLLKVRRMATPAMKSRVMAGAALCNILLVIVHYRLRGGVPGPLAMTAGPSLAFAVAGLLTKPRPGTGDDGAPAGAVPASSLGKLAGWIGWAVIFQFQAWSVGLAVFCVLDFWIPSAGWPSGEIIRGRIYSILPPALEARDAHGNRIELSAMTERLQKFDPEGRLVWAASPRQAVDLEFMRIEIGENDSVVLQGDHGHRETFTSGGLTLKPSTRGSAGRDRPRR